MKKIFNIIEILSDLKDLEKKIYLDSPESDLLFCGQNF